MVQNILCLLGFHEWAEAVCYDKSSKLKPFNIGDMICQSVKRRPCKWVQQTCVVCGKTVVRYQDTDNYAVLDGTNVEIPRHRHNWVNDSEGNTYGGDRKCTICGLRQQMCDHNYCGQGDWGDEGHSMSWENTWDDEQ